MGKTDFQPEKRLVRDLYAALDAAPADRAAAAIAPFVAPDWHWRGMHPFHEQTGADAVGEVFWSPLKRAMGPLQRRADMFLAGLNYTDGYKTTWVVEMGHLMGLWDEAFLGMPPSRKIAFLRYVEFHRIENGVIVETASFNDLVSMMYQTGLRPFPPQTGAMILTPGPRTHDGMNHGVHDPGEGQKTLGLINGMIEELIGLDAASPLDHLAKWWTPDMCWFGPTGIGASAFFKGYHRGHTIPFEDGLDFVKHHGHIARLAEGTVGGFFGWPSMTMIPTGGFMGMPAAEAADMRIVDMYRRQGDKLAENWIFIDMLHFFAMQGLDVLTRTVEIGRG